MSDKAKARLILCSIVVAVLMTFAPSVGGPIFFAIIVLACLAVFFRLALFFVRLVAAAFGRGVSGR